ncbi:MAG TPA: hypothetical protein VH419_08175 [Nocardioidaceae bacterium]
MDVAEVSRELYGLPLEEFTATRNARAKQLKADGDADAARRVQALKKPTLAAWLVNQLVRREPGQIGQLLDLGQQMRAGMSGSTSDDLRQLTKRRYQLVSSLVNAALAATGDRRPGADVATDVQATLEATLSDPDSAQSVQDGCLEAPLHASGFGFVRRPEAEVEEEPGPDADVVDIAAHRERREKALAAARTRVEAAQTAAAEADTKRAESQRLLDKAEAAERKAAAEVRRLETSLERAATALAKRTEAAEQARSELEEAEEAAQDAHDELTDATDAERRLTDR